MRKRILEYEHIKEKVAQRREERTKLEHKLDRLNDYLEKLKDDLAEQRINNLKNSFPDEDKEIEAKDTHVDLNMEMYIVHNKGYYIQFFHCQTLSLLHYKVKNIC